MTILSGRSGDHSAGSKTRRASAAVAAPSSIKAARGQRRPMSASASASQPASQNARPARPRSVAMRSAVPKGESWMP
jgi:hypothetical protein